MSTRQESDQYIVSELSKIGIQVLSVFDLVNTKKSYPEAIPILLNCFDRIDDVVIKEALVRALTVKEAEGYANRKMIQEFLAIPSNAAPPEQLLKWAIGNSLSVIATDADYDDLVNIATSKEHGKAREMIVAALGKMKNPEAGKVLTELLTDDTVVGHAVMALNNLRYLPALPVLESLRNHQKPWVQKEIDKAMQKLSSMRSTGRPSRRNPTV